MPKIIENLREKLVFEAKRQVAERGYAALTIRSVAAACGVGVGTVYNYFASKDALVAGFMLEDWQRCIRAIEAAGTDAQTAEPVIRCIYDQVNDFIALYQSLFSDEAAVSSFSGSPSPYHSLLRAQLAKPLEKFCQDPFTAEFISESLLTWTVAGRDFDEIYGLIKKLL